MEEWKEYRLGDVCTIVGRIGFRGYTTEDLTSNPDDGAITLSPTNIIEGEIELSKPTYIKWPKYYESPEIMLEQNDIVLVKTGSSIGRTARIREIVHPMTLNPQFVVLKEIKTDNVFLSYVIKSFYFQALLKTITVGSAIPTLSQKNLSNLIIKVPDIIVQRKIAAILSSLDDKIEVNKRINDNLEQQAQALFKSWFVDFEPFKDGEFVESELGIIPKDLIVKRVSEIPHTIETGRRPKGGVGEITSGVPSVGAEHVKGLGNYDFSKTKYISKEYAASLKTGKVNGYELLIYKDGGKPGYFIPNYSIFGEGYPFEECYLNEHVFKLDFGDKGYNAFCFFYFWTDYVMNYLNAQGGKAAIPGINRQDVENIMIFAPDNEMVKRFGDLVLLLIKQILFNCKESRRLAQLRDTLLPRLMSGEFEVKEIMI